METQHNVSRSKRADRSNIHFCFFYQIGSVFVGFKSFCFNLIKMIV